MKKIISALFISGSLFLTTAPAFAAELGTSEGTTKVEITDYTIDPNTQLPSDPGKYLLNQVPNIDFGKHSLESVADVNQTFNGTYQGDLNITDTRPTQASITSALEQINAVEANPGETTPEAIAASKTAWTNAIAASAWRIDAKATQLDGIGTSLTIGHKEVLTGSNTIVSESATEPVGTKSYLDQLAAPTLTIANNNLNVKQYNGTITYSAVNAL